MRAKDMHMGATIYPDERTIFVTGAIDTNDFKIKVRIKVPDSGIWKIIKAETNLTDETWTSWKVGFGEGNSPADVSHFMPSCRQFASVARDAEQNCVVFYNGEIRPGEPILKSFAVSVEQGYTEVCMNHNRSQVIIEGSAEDILEYYTNQKLPEIEILVPSVIVGDKETSYYEVPGFQFA